MEKVDLEGWIRLSRSSIFSREPINGKRARLGVSYSNRSVGLSVFSTKHDGTTERVGLMLQMSSFNLFIEAFLAFVKRAPTEKCHESLFVEAIKSSSDPMNKDLMYGFNPEAGFWMCIKQDGIDPIQFIFEPARWSPLKLGSGEFQTRTMASTLSAKAWLKGTRDNLIGIDNIYITSIGDEGGATPPPMGAGGGGGVGGGGGDDGGDDVPF